MNYNRTVAKVMAFLKEKEVCASSRKSHKDCYESLGRFMCQRNETYSTLVREDWLLELKKELPAQRYNVWRLYALQLEEMDSTGTISDRRLFLNRSNYDKLPELLRNDLNLYLEDCRKRYTSDTLNRTRIYCSEGLLLLHDIGVQSMADINYDVVMQMVNTKMYCSNDTRTLILNNTSRMISFYAKAGFFSTNLSLLFNGQIYNHIGSSSEFSEENRAALENAKSNGTLTRDEYYSSVNPFLDLLKKHGYVGTTLYLAKHALTSHYLFLEVHSLDFCIDNLWIWFSEIKSTLGRSRFHWRRVLRFYEDYVLTGSIHPDGKYKYRLNSFDELPSWCKQAISGLLDQKAREFRSKGTIKGYRCHSTRFCSFLVDHGYESFKELSPATIKEFSLQDEHSTFKGRASCFAIIRSLLRYLDEYGYTDNHGLEECLMTGTAPQETIIDVLSDDQLRRISEFRKCHKKAIELRDIAMVLLGLKMGLRACDILSLRFQDIDWKKRQISIVMIKTKAEITLPMPVDVGNAIYSYISSGRPRSETDLVFIRSKAPYGKLTSKVCTKALYRILPERKDVTGGGFHVTRRTFATNLLRNHAGIDEVMDALGHRDPTSVMKYLLLDDERSRKCGLSLDAVGLLMEGGIH